MGDMVFNGGVSVLLSNDRTDGMAQASMVSGEAINSELLRVPSVYAYLISQIHCSERHVQRRQDGHFQRLELG